MKFTFKPVYFIFFILLLATEILIAIYTDNWIRAYFGDFLVVILIYCFINGFVKIKKQQAIIGVLLFSCLVEILQYFKIVEILGLQDIAIANTLIGTSFSWIDMLMYTLGALFIAIVEFFPKPKFA